MKNKILEKLRWIKQNSKLIIILLVTLFLLLISCKKSHGQSPMVAMALITGVAGGKHVVDGPLTTDLARAGSPELLLNEIDRQIVKIRPMATPIDQLSRCAGSKHAGSMVVDYYNVDTKATSATVTRTYTEPSTTEAAATTDAVKVKLSTSDDEIFDVSDTILVKGVFGYEPDGVTESKHDLVLYVVSKTDEGAITVMAVNGKKIGDAQGCVPSIEAGTALVRMGRAASELDVQSPQFEALPRKAQNYCQIFKMQVEQSTLQRLSSKEVDWSMTDQEEAAIYDMRLGMEKSFLFGVKRKLWDPAKKENIMLTGGVWFQAGKQFNYGENALNQDGIVDLMREAFTGNAGSKRKVLIGGSGLISRLNKMDYSKVVTAGDNVVKWGIDFSQLRSKFGTLYVMLSEIFDEVDMPDNGIVIDPDYLQK